MPRPLPRLVVISIRNGSLAAALGFVFLIALYFLGKHPFLFPVYFDFRIVLFTVFMVLGLKELRDDYQQGELSFGQGMMTNLLFTIVFATLAAALIWTFCMLHPQFLSDYIQTATEQIKSIEPQVIEQLGKDVYDRNLQALPATNGSDLALDYLVKSFIISFFISMILSVILRKQPKG
jgi:hypothetical protein